MEMEKTADATAPTQGQHLFIAYLSAADMCARQMGEGGWVCGGGNVIKSVAGNRKRGSYVVCGGTW
eukprot:scaffold29942_cov197-Isochrysis_galbana.AAC.1